MNERILLVEDDAGIAEGISVALAKWGMQTRCVEDFNRVMACFTDYEPHLVLLDITLPFMNGYHWCHEIRKVSNLPIVFLSSAGDNMSLIMAVNAGADDFIAKPVDQNVLVAKLQAILRRAYDFSGGVKKYQIGPFELQPETNLLVAGEQKIELSKNEYRILLLLLQNRGKIVSREKMMETLWATDSFVDENTLTVNVGRLRKKLTAFGMKDPIVTKFGMGYLLEEEK